MTTEALITMLTVWTIVIAFNIKFITKALRSEKEKKNANEQK
jgi:hypothetical protein